MILVVFFIISITICSVWTFISAVQYDELLSRTPDAFIIGVMKAGTTSLHKLFEGHPDWCCADEKEKHWFDQHKNYVKGPEEYKKIYKNCEPNSLTMDATPSYIKDKKCPNRIVKSYNSSDLRNKRFILSLREPVTRHYSEYLFRIRNCLRQFEHKNFHIMERLNDIAKPDFCASHSRSLSFTSSASDTNSSTTETSLGAESTSPAANSDAAFETFLEQQGNSREQRGRILKHVSDEARADSNCKKVAIDYVSGADLDDIQFMTFAEWTSSRYGEEARFRGHYLVQIKNWLQYIPRNQVFIVSFETLLTETTSVMMRLHEFLRVKNGWGESVSLPLPRAPKAPSHFNGYNFEMDCTTYDQLEFHFKAVNGNLIELVNAKNLTNNEDRVLWGHRPPSEPDFPPWENTRKKCTGVSHFRGGSDVFAFDDDFTDDDGDDDGDTVDGLGASDDGTDAVGDFSEDDDDDSADDEDDDDDDDA